MAKKYIITVKEDNRILRMGKELDHLDNGYPRLVEEDVSFPTEMVNVYGPVEVPEGVEPDKHCYAMEKGFFENPDYEEPEPKLKSAK